jgi:hypothetical protein
VSDSGATIHGGIVVMACVAEAFSIHGVDVTGAGKVPMPRLPGEGRVEPPSPLDTMRNSSVKSSIMAHRTDDVPL